MTTATKQTNAQWFSAKYLTGATTRLDCNFEQYMTDMGFALEFIDQARAADERLCLVSITDSDDSSKCYALIYCNGGWAIAEEVGMDSSLEELAIEWHENNQDNTPELVLAVAHGSIAMF